MKTGLLMDVNGDLAVSSGELVVGNTTYQNEYIILKSQRGEIKEYPLMGVGIDDIVNDHDEAGWKMKIKEHLAMDDIKVAKIFLSITTGKLEIEQ
ncbi:MAG TPA: hypothetical protein PLN63_00020 [Paludibacteraceae bacterium]|nr:hypothetical protein [Paludibacteraceae bacterium]